MKQDYYENKILLKFLKISPNIKIEDDNMNNVLHYIAEDGNLDLANEFLNLAVLVSVPFGTGFFKSSIQSSTNTFVFTFK